MSAESINWEAASALVATIGLAITSFITWRGGKRAVVTYEHFTVQGEIAALSANDFQSSVLARRTVLKSCGRHIHGFRARIKIDAIDKTLSAKVSKTTSIDEDDVRISVEENGILINIDELPAGETVSIDVFLQSHYSHEYNYIVGGNAKFRLEQNNDFFQRRLGVVIIGTIVSIGGAVLMRNLLGS